MENSNTVVFEKTDIFSNLEFLQGSIFGSVLWVMLILAFVFIFVYIILNIKKRKSDEKKANINSIRKPKLIVKKHNKKPTSL